jgi:hypothetical protein
MEPRWEGVIVSGDARLSFWAFRISVFPVLESCSNDSAGFSGLAIGSELAVIVLGSYCNSAICYHVLPIKKLISGTLTETL